MLKKDTCTQIKRAHHGLYANIKKQCILRIFMASKDKRKCHKLSKTARVEAKEN